MRASIRSRSSATTYKSAQTTRFNLLLLEDGEYFLDVRVVAGGIA